MLKLRTVFLAAVWFQALVLLLAPSPSQAAMEWSSLKQLGLDKEPLDVATSEDGRYLFILVNGEILAYSIPEYKLTDKIPVEPNFDRLATGKNNTLLLTSKPKKELRVLQLTMRHAFDLSGLAVKGPADAPVTIVVFSDFQCPYCASLQPLLQQVMEKFPKEAKIVEKNFPLQMHKFARQAATAALAAHRQDSFWEFHKKLFESMASLSDAKVQEIAKQLNLDMERFNRDLKDPAIQNLISRDLQEGSPAGVRGTPTIFVNGKLIANRSLEGFQQMIGEELKKK